MKATLRLLAVLAAAGTALPLAAGTTARAADGDTDAVALVGTAALAPPLQLVGGVGDFAFRSLACEMVSSDGEFGACTVEAAGVYNNIVCGTGSAAGAAEAAEIADSSVDDLNFSVTFLAGIGVVTGGATGVVVITPAQPATPPACANGLIVVETVVLS